MLENFELEIEDGSFTVLVGPSGCGKTTIIRVISGLEDIQKGNLYINDKRINDIDPGDREIAMVFQNYALYPHMTVEKNISFGLENSGYKKQEIKVILDRVLEIVGLTEYRVTKPSQLSGGQRQRVALARAISKNPKVFLMDEPLSNLDAKLRIKMRSELVRLHNRLKSTFIYITHDQVEAMTMADTIVVLNEGKIMQKGSPMEIFSNPQNLFTARFIGDPGMNIMSQKDGNYLGFRSSDVSLNKEEGFEGITFSGIFSTKERLGNEVNYTLIYNGEELSIRLKEDLPIDVNYKFYVKKENLYGFAKTEERMDIESIRIDSELLEEKND